MSIPIRFDFAGNNAVVKWSPEQVKKEWKRRNLYEIAFTSDDDLAIVFGDIDVHTPDMSPDQFQTLNNAYYTAITKFVGGHRFAIASASSYAASKISWRFYVPDMVATALAQREWAENVNNQRGIVLEDGTHVELDTGVYHKGRKMRMLHAWKQTKNGEGILEQDAERWENRPLVLIYGEEEDTILHKISENAERITSSKSKKTPCLAYNDFDLIRKLVIDCLDNTRADDYISWRNTLWAIKSVEDTERGKELAHDFSKKSGRYDARSVDRTWRDGKNQLTAGSIHYWARNDNPVKYADLTAKLPVEFLEEQLAEGDIGLARIFAKVYEGIIVGVNTNTRRTYWAFNFTTGLWSEQKDDYIITVFTSNMKHILTPLAIKMAAEYKDIADNEEGKVHKKKIEKVLDIIKQMTLTKTATKCIPQIYQTLLQDKQWENDHLNTKRDILPVANGVLELRTGTIRPYELEDYLTFKLSVNYNPDADLSKHDKFFKDVLHNDEDAIKFIHYFMGYCITGETNRQQLLILEGSLEGSNGKSVMMECLLSVLGKQYYATINRKALGNTTSQNNDSVYDARFARVACIPEMNKQGNDLDEGLIKNITGSEQINVSAKFKNAISFQPQFKVLMPLNEMFPVAADSGAMWRRLIVMPFKVRFLSPDNAEWDDEMAEQGWIKEKDDNFARELREDSEGWLAWLVEGAKQYYAQPSREPPMSLQHHLLKKQEENNPHLKHIRKTYKITGLATDYITVSEITNGFHAPADEKETQTQRRIGAVMKKLGINKSTRDIYPTKRENVYVAETGQWEWKNVEDATQKPTKTKVWTGLRQKTREEEEDYDSS
jgi:P4 family phage/plasmid primase-like protien